MSIFFFIIWWNIGQNTTGRSFKKLFFFVFYLRKQFRTRELSWALMSIHSNVDMSWSNMDHFQVCTYWKSTHNLLLKNVQYDISRPLRSCKIKKKQKWLQYCRTPCKTILILPTRLCAFQFRRQFWNKNFLNVISFIYTLNPHNFYYTKPSQLSPPPWFLNQVHMSFFFCHTG